MIELRNLSFSYGKKEILKGFNFSFEKSLCILGENGCGKSTLMRCMLGLLSYSGEIFLDGRELKTYSTKALASKFAYIPANFNSSFEYLVIDLLLMARLSKLGLFNRFGSKDYEIADLALKRLGIFELRNRPISALSSGQKQLVYAARALCAEAKLIFMDEPTSALSFGNQIRFLELIKELCNDGLNFVITTHQPKIAKQIADEVLMIKEGKQFIFGDISEINDENLSAIYEIDYKKYKNLI